MGTLEEHLLKTRKQVKCSGCRVALSAVDGAPPPYKSLSLLVVVVLCNVLPVASIYPFVYFMVRDLGIADRDIGIYAGFLGSSFMFGRFVASVPCGIAADKFGRRPILIASVVGVIIVGPIFGASTSFWVAVVARFFLGCFNGSVAPIKAYASELCSDEHQAVGIAAVGTAVGLGNMLGPAIGGYFSQPALKYPALFPPGSLFARFPYLLPSLIISGVSFVGFFIALHLPETLHFHDKEDAGVTDAYSDEKGQVAVTGCKDADEKQEQPPQRSRHPLLKYWPLISSTTIFCLWSVHDMAYNEVFSLYALSPKSAGGLGFTTTEVGNVLTAAGAALLVFQMTSFPPLARRLGAVGITRIPMILSLPLLCVYPPMAGLTGLALWVTVILACIAKSVFSTATMAGASLLINNSVKPSQRGSASGISMSLTALFKAVGPGAGGAVFAWAQTRNSAFFPGNEVVFFVLGLVALLTVLCSLEPCLPPSLNKKKHEEEED